MLIMNLFILTIKELILRGSCSSSFYFHETSPIIWIVKPAPRTRDTVVVDSWYGGGGERGKADRKQNTLAPWVMKPNS